LGGIDGLANVKVDLTFGTATYDEAKPVDEALVKATIERIGFTPGNFR
jgi:copper chaperone